MSMPASDRSRVISRFRSGDNDAGGAPVTRTVIGPSNRVKIGSNFPDSRAKPSARKSCARSAFDLTVRTGCGVENTFIAGRAACEAMARVGMSLYDTGIQAFNASSAGNTNLRISLSCI